MRTDELRSVLHQHGDAVPDTGAAGRAESVRRRVRTARRRRAAGAAGGLAAAVALTAMVVVPDLGPTPEPVPAAPAGSDYAKDGVTFRGEVDGERLVDARIGDPGTTRVRFDITVPETGLRFSPVCYGVGGRYQVTMSLAGYDVAGRSCDARKDPDPGAHGITFTDDPVSPLREWGLRPGDTAWVEVWLSRTSDPARETVDQPEAVVGAGIYEDLGGQAAPGSPIDLPPSLDHHGETWVLDSVEQTGPGERLLVVAAGRADQEVLLVEARRGLRLPAEYEVDIDGRYAGHARLTADDWVVDGLEGDSTEPWTVVDRLPAGPRRTVLLQVTRGVTADTWLALAEYVRASD